MTTAAPIRDSAYAEHLYEVIATSEHICLASRDLVKKTAERVSELRRNRREWGWWREVWAVCRKHPDHILVLCAGCGQVRGPGGQWGHIPLMVSQTLSVGGNPTVSHGLCPDCLAGTSCRLMFPGAAEPAR